MDEKNHNSKSPIKFKLQLNEEQKLVKANILVHPFNFIKGSAGSGKTLTAVQIALDKLMRKEIEKIVITRPTVGTEDNGFLPGTLKEKLEPWMEPIKSNLCKLYRPDYIQKLYEDGKIEMISLSHFRGRTFDDAVCIIDEFQNLTKSQLQMALGRLGKDSMMIFCGDHQQIDLFNKNDSAIHDLAKIKESKFVYIETLNENHRHEAVKEVLQLLND